MIIFWSLKSRRTLIKRVYTVQHFFVRSAVDLAYALYGESTTAAPIIALHGLLGSKKNWTSVSRRLAEATGTAVYALDARNHGESPHTNTHTYYDLASDVSQFIDKLSLKDPTIIGHSMGGRTGMVLALTEPKKVKRLVVCDISPVSTPGLLNDFFPRLIDALKAVTFKPGVSAGNAKIEAKKALESMNVAKNIDGFILMNIGERPDKTIGWVNNLDVLKNSFKSIATFPSELSGKQYSGPTLFVAGGESDYLPPSDLTAIRVMFPNATLEVIPNSGHNVHVEDPPAFFNVVMKFLSSTQ